MLIKIGSFICCINYLFLSIYLYYINDFNIIILYFFISIAAIGKGLIIPSVSGLIVNFNERISGTALGFLSFIKLIFAAFSILFIVRLSYTKLLFNFFIIFSPLYYKFNLNFFS